MFQRPHCFALMLVLTVILVGRSTAQTTTTGFLEEFALSDDRRAVLKQLVPGTVDYYFYSCLERQHVGDWLGAQEILQAWIQRHGRSRKVVEIENRQSLLTFSTTPEETFTFLKKRLGYRYDHQPQAGTAKPGLPTALNAAETTLAAWTRRALDKYPGTLKGIRESGLSSLAVSGLSDSMLAEFLNRLPMPDVANLPELVVRNLAGRQGRSFGSLRIHRELTIEQLDACARLRPELLNESSFVSCYVRRLQPTGDSGWRHDSKTREAYLNRLQAFADRLSSSQNSFKAHVLYHRLQHDLAQGVFQKQRFVSYLRLPRPSPWVNQEFLRQAADRKTQVNPRQNYDTGLGRGDDSSLVRSFFEHFFKTAENWDDYREFVSENYLKRIFAETKILSGIGDMERWYTLLDDPSYYESLKERIEIQLAPSNKRRYAPDEDVRITADIKNVGTLLVKVYELNAAGFYRDQNKEIDASLEIDGLVASEEFTFNYQEAPLRRVRRSFNFPTLKGPGVWIIDFIGNGISSRSVITKGRLRCTERLGAAGHVFRVLDDDGNHLKNAGLYFGRKFYDADKDGEIYVPYSTSPGRKPIILVAGERATLEQFSHRSESYRLEAPVLIKRESLVGGGSADVVIRPRLTLNGFSVPLSLLEKPLLTIRSSDHFGVASSITIDNLELKDGRDLVHRIRVPQNLSWLSAELSGEVKVISTGKPAKLRGARATYQLNQIDRTARTIAPLLTRTPAGWDIYVLGKNGEPIADLAVGVHLHHDWFTTPYRAELKSDQNGRVRLGRLEGISRIAAPQFIDGRNSWNLQSHASEFPTRIHAARGETVRVPHLGRSASPTRNEYALFEIRGGVICRDMFQNLAMVNGFLELRGLPAGEYDLALKQRGAIVRVLVSDGSRKEGWAASAGRALELDVHSPLHVAETSLRDGRLVVQCRNTTPSTRVHVMATHFMPAKDPWQSLRVRSTPSPVVEALAPPESLFTSGRRIGDEFRYVLERRFAKKFPGNMLERPQLLLNPWALNEADETIGLGGGAGGRYGGRRSGRRGRGRKQGASPGAAEGNPGTFANLDFLGAQETIRANLKPDDNGRISIPLAELGDGHMIHVIAVDGDESVYRTHLREPRVLERVDRRLARTLDVEKFYSQQQTISVHETGNSVVIPDTGSSQAQPFDTLADVYELFRTLSGSPDLDTFRVLTEWPSLDDEGKLDFYSLHACHELHFFLSKKDPAFFDAVVKPYLANKSDKWFMDDYLLENTLEPYTESWAWSRLNLVEKILLLHQIEEDRTRAAGFVEDLFDLTPAQIGTLQAMFESTLKAGALKPGADRAPTGGGVNGLFLGRRPAAKAPMRKRKVLEKAKALSVEEPEEETEDFDNEEIVEDSEVLDEMSRFKKAEERQDRKSADKDKAFRARAEQLYQALESTRRYVEHNYWHRSTRDTTPEMIPVNAFWRDFAAHDGRKPFLSSNFHQVTSSTAEMLLALSVMDLPFKAGSHKSAEQDGRATIEAASPLILVRQEIRETAAAEGTSPILISQSFFRADDPHYFVGQEKRDKYVTGEFLKGVVYGCRVVVTNPSSAPRALNLLMQIPAGSIAVSGTRGLVSRPVRVDGYHTITQEYFFYFPETGDYAHYPVQASAENRVVASSPAASFKVVEVLSKVDTSSWQHISQNGTVDEVLRYLENTNPGRTDLSLIAWRMKTQDVFEKVTTLLRRRLVYDKTLWSYALYHGDIAATGEALRHNRNFTSQCGSYLASPLLAINPIERKTYEHVEYAPLVNARAHQFGGRRKIQNTSLSNQFDSLMRRMAYKPTLSDEDWLEVTYYMLLQDRVEDALASFARINAGRISSQVQYDYMKAYLDFFSESPRLARSIAERYKNHPVRRWRNRFRIVLTQLDEIEQNVGQSAEDDGGKAQEDIAARQPTLDLKVEAREIIINHNNIKECELAFYEMDIEFLFSAKPFVRDDSGSFAWVKPNTEQTISLNKTGSITRVKLPDSYRNSNLMVEIRGAGLVRRQTCYANSINLELSENFGRLRVTQAESGKAMPKVYVKVFAREKNGRVRFHKDGYTDHRGRFDYASLSGSEGRNAARFSILVISEESGAMVREADAPAR